MYPRGSRKPAPSPSASGPEVSTPTGHVRAGSMVEPPPAYGYDPLMTPHYPLARSASDSYSGGGGGWRASTDAGDVGSCDASHGGFDQRPAPAAMGGGHAHANYRRGGSAGGVWASSTSNAGAAASLRGSFAGPYTSTDLPPPPTYPYPRGREGSYLASLSGGADGGGSRGYPTAPNSPLVPEHRGAGVVNDHAPYNPHTPHTAWYGAAEYHLGGRPPPQYAYEADGRPPWPVGNVEARGGTGYGAPPPPSYEPHPMGAALPATRPPHPPPPPPLRYPPPPPHPPPHQPWYPHQPSPRWTGGEGAGSALLSSPVQAVYGAGQPPSSPGKASTTHTAEEGKGGDSVLTARSPTAAPAPPASSSPSSDVRTSVPQASDARYAHLYEEFTRVSRIRGRLAQENERLKRDMQSVATELSYFRSRAARLAQEGATLRSHHAQDVLLLLEILDSLLGLQTAKTTAGDSIVDGRRAKAAALDMVLRQMQEGGGVAGYDSRGNGARAGGVASPPTPPSSTVPSAHAAHVARQATAGPAETARWISQALRLHIEADGVCATTPGAEPMESEEGSPEKVANAEAHPGRPPVRAIPSISGKAAPATSTMVDGGGGDDAAPTAAAAATDSGDARVVGDTALLVRDEVTSLLASTHRELRLFLAAMDYCSPPSPSAAASSPEARHGSVSSPSALGALTGAGGAIQLTLHVPPSALHANATDRLLSGNARDRAPVQRPPSCPMTTGSFNGKADGGSATGVHGPVMAPTAYSHASTWSAGGSSTRSGGGPAIPLETPLVGPRPQQRRGSGYYAHHVHTPVAPRGAGESAMGAGPGGSGIAVAAPPPSHTSGSQVTGPTG